MRRSTKIAIAAVAIAGLITLGGCTTDPNVAPPDESGAPAPEAGTNEWFDQVPVTLTFGVATGVSCEPSELFAAADQQLNDYKSVRPMISVLRRHEESNGPFVA